MCRGIFAACMYQTSQDRGPAVTRDKQAVRFRLKIRSTLVNIRSGPRILVLFLTVCPSSEMLTPVNLFVAFKVLN